MYFNRKLQKRQVYKAKEVKLKEKLEEETEIRKEEEKNHQLRDQYLFTLIDNRVICLFSSNG